MRRPDTVVARTSWRQVDFISDLHLHAADQATFAAWKHYLQRTSAQAVFMLGDVFDVWIGDDILSQPIHAQSEEARFAVECARVLRQVSQHLDLFFICGNRDFLIGAAFLQECAMQGLDDPCVLELGSTRCVLSHGDALCLDDAAYQQFRTLVRSGPWQADFLGQPLQQRQVVARQLRAQSEQHKRAHPEPSQVDAPTVMAWLRDAHAGVLVHGHTHQPADHVLLEGKHRIVLSDWDVQATPPRAQILRLTLSAAGEPVSWLRLSPAQAC